MTESSLPTKVVRYAEGDGLNLGSATNKEESFRKYARSLAEPVVTRETFAEFKAMGDAEQHRLKRIAGWTIRCHVEHGKRTRENIGPGDMITLDIDNATPAWQEALLAGEVLPGVALAAHTTRSHTPENPRFRVVLPTKSKIDPEDYQRAVRVIARLLDPDMDLVDKVSARTAQLMYRPSCSKDMKRHFRFYEQEGKLFDWEQAVADWERETGLDSHDITKLPRFKGESELRESAEKVEDPLTKKGPVGYFCRAYSISELVTGKDNEPPILEGIYEVSEWNPDGTPSRLTYLLGHSQNGVVLYNSDTLCYSHHGSDPACDRTLNAFDLVRYHKFHAADDDQNKPMAQRESWKPMIEFCKTLPAYKRQMGLDRYDMAAMALDTDDDDLSWVEGSTGDDLLGFDHLMAEQRQKAAAEVEDLLGFPVQTEFAAGRNYYKRMRAAKPPENWIATKLELTQNGDIKPTSYNFSQIVANDSRLWRKIAYDQFSNQIVLLDDIKTRSDIPPVICRDKEHGQNWQDYNDVVIRAILEGPAGQGSPGYGVKVADRDMSSAVTLASRLNAFHPILDQIENWRSMKWDGVDRISPFLSRYVGAEQNIYTASAFRMMLLASIARVTTPGCKFDYMLILEGLTGIGKSTLIKILYGERYFGELDCDLSNRQQIAEQIAGKWAVEIAELGALNKSDYNHAKIFLRRQYDDVRMVYAKTVAEMPRQCVVWGTTNESIYLKDSTGNRSYWVVKCGSDAIDFAAILRERDQLWTQAVAEYDQMRARYPHGDLPLTLTGEALEIAKGVQEVARKKEVWEKLFDMLVDFSDREFSVDHLFNQIGLPADVALKFENGTPVRPACFSQCNLETILGMKPEVFLRGDVNDHWNKLNAFIKNAPGWEKCKTRVHGVQRQWIFFPGTTEEDRKRGFRLPQVAKPEESHDDLI